MCCPVREITDAIRNGTFLERFFDMAKKLECLRKSLSWNENLPAQFENHKRDYPAISIIFSSLEAGNLGRRSKKRPKQKEITNTPAATKAAPTLKVPIGTTTDDKNSRMAKIGRPDRDKNETSSPKDAADLSFRIVVNIREMPAEIIHKIIPYALGPAKGYPKIELDHTIIPDEIFEMITKYIVNSKDKSFVRNE
jgi:hypothetical protein